MRLLAAILLYVVLVAMVAFLWEQPMLLLGLLALLAAIALGVQRTRGAFAYFLCGGVLGPSAESLAIARGAWTYANTDLLFPLWLPLAWGLAAIAMYNVTDATLALINRED